MTAYNLTFMDGNATIQGVLQGINDGVSGTLGAGIMISIMIVVLVSLSYQGMENSLIVSSFIGVILGGFLAALGIMNATLLFVPVIMLISGIIAKQINKE